jgi:hypothetical protein
MFIAAGAGGGLYLSVADESETTNVTIDVTGVVAGNNTAGKLSEEGCAAPLCPPAV